MKSRMFCLVLDSGTVSNSGSEASCRGRFGFDLSIIVESSEDPGRAVQVMGVDQVEWVDLCGLAVMLYEVLLSK